jgi:hypothetical protein
MLQYKVIIIGFRSVEQACLIINQLNRIDGKNIIGFAV